MRHCRLGGAFRGERCSQSCSTGCWSIEKLCCSREKAEEEERISCANKWTQPNQAGLTAKGREMLSRMFREILSSEG